MENLDQANILITGGNGMLGKAILKKLQHLGCKTIYSPGSGEMDLLSPNSIKDYLEYKEIDIIFHLASLVFGLQGNSNNQLQSFIQNTKIYSNLLEYVEKYKTVKKIFFAGTVAAYPEKKLSLKLTENMFFDGEPHFGEYGYASAKRHAFAHLKILKSCSNIDFTYGIFTNMYGPNDTYDLVNGHVIPSLIKKGSIAKLKCTNKLNVWGNPNSSRDFMHVDDAAAAAVLLTQKSTELCNICTGVESQMIEAANIIRNHYNLKELIWDNSMPIGISNRFISNNKLQELNFTCNYTLETGLGHACEWYDVYGEI
jgi:GDP-L-fucose synthase